VDSNQTKKTIILFGAIFIALGAYFLLEGAFPGYFPELNSQTSLALIFMLGLFTSLHCVAMCGGFVLSYSAKHKQEENGEKKFRLPSKATFLEHVQYSAGKLLSYSVIGALFGLLGSIVVFTPQLRGIAAVIAGFFLLIFGVNQLGFFKSLRKISLPAPKSLTRFVVSNKNRGPFFVGLMNGLMIACGPLQALYIFAASTGSAIAGAQILFVFGLGTLPLMILFGFFVSVISGQFTQKIMRLSGVLVIAMGLMLFANGFALAGIDLSFPGQTAQNNGNNNANLPIVAQEIRMEINSKGYSPNNFTITRGTPVKWIINVTKLTSCNNELLVPALGIQKKLVIGKQIIEFTPAKLGTIQFSCWMGMIRGSFKVVPADATAQSSAAATKEYYPAQQGMPKGCGCGGGGSGSCGG